ncbi:anaerobic C4-dicarboxylate transporter family protein [Budvicia aquatica]|uniref:C4-dicarboxylate transporter n=2 Tax=Budvicia aquatica TaxID=82979 RepID=A0A2C6DN18_9GAMM|nr:anaerobic C4-dicarboxylate transporter family protein [Budvicia aquatica]PHI29722.1 C4-dicarboxylate ABC transporter [Budvicia aquatica]
MDLFLVQLAVVLVCIAIGGKIGGIGLGAAGGMGLFILSFLFHLEPDSPPVSVMLIIISVITCITILQAAGGLDLLVSLAERMLRTRPNAITFLGPFVCYIFTIMCGTSYIAFSVYPVIAEIATDARVRPERAMSMSVIAANMALVASPISAVVVGMLAKAVSLNISLLDILLITVPGTMLGCLAGCLFVYKKGAELSEDDEFIRRQQAGEFDLTTLSAAKIGNLTRAKIGLAIFAIGVFLIVILSSVKEMRPMWHGETMSVSTTLQILMLTTASLIMIFCRIAPEKLHEGSTFKSGLIGVVGIFGLSWMTGTFFGNYNDVFITNFSDILNQYPMIFGLVLFFLSILIYSPAATIIALMPLGVAMGLPAYTLIALLPAACAVFIIPGGAQIACVAFDRTGTTRLGKYVINHSFLLPGMVSLVMSVVFCMMIAKTLF